MNFKQALKILDIEDYGERIFNSNSHGELFHIMDYIQAAKAIKKTNLDKKQFREWFVERVNYAELNWKRPESVFQHIFKV